MIYEWDRKYYTMKGIYEPPARIVVSGSGGQAEYEKLQKAIQDNRNTLTSSKQASESEIREKYDSIMEKEQAIILGFIKDHPASHLSANQLFYVLNENNLSECKELYQALTEQVKGSYEGKKVTERIAALESVQTGMTAPDFSQPDTLGNSVALSSFSGKYVLLEFWASWCGPCRAEGPNLLKAYNRYKDSGLVILAVSLDKDAEKWKEAIVKDNLPWIHVSDLKYFSNRVAELYGVHAIPSNFLISPEGKIIAKNLRGESLHQVLESLWNNKISE